MNYYSMTIDDNQPLKKNDFKALMLMYLTSDDFDITIVDREQTIITGHLSYSLSNLNANRELLTNPIYSTEFQNTIERFDKPIVETGDIVLAVVDSKQDEEMSKYYNEYIKFQLPMAYVPSPNSKDPNNPDNLAVTIYLGVSNSSKSDFNTPFKEALEIVITSQKQLGELLVNTDF